MSQDRSARKKGGLQPDRITIKKSGREKSGAKLAGFSLQPIHSVYRAMIQVKCHTIPSLKYTDGPNTLIYRRPRVIAEDAIQVSIGVDSGAENVKRLERNKKVEYAIDALLRRIWNELYFVESTGNGNATDTTGGRDGKRRNGKENIKGAE